MAREVREYFYTLVTCLGEGTACQESIPSEVSNLVECHNGDNVVVSNILTTAPEGYKIDSVRIYCAVTMVDSMVRNKSQCS